MCTLPRHKICYTECVKNQSNTDENDVVKLRAQREKNKVKHAGSEQTFIRGVLSPEQRKHLQEREAQEYFAIHASDRHPAVKHYHKSSHFLKWAVRLLIPDFFVGHPNLWDNLRTLRRHPRFRPLRLAVVAWLMFTAMLASAGIYSLTHSPASFADTTADDTQAEFDAGTYNDTQWDGADSWVELTSGGQTAGNGDYTSSVKDVGAPSSWDTLSWLTQRPYGKELPDNAATETGYPAGNMDMTENVLLMHMNESSGTIEDTSGNNKDGTPSGGITHGAVGKLGSALSFDGDDDYVELGSIASGDPLMLNNTDMTISMWINPTLTGDDHQRLIDKSTSGGGAGGYSFIVRPSGSLSVWVDGTQSAGSAFRLEPNVWQHIVWTHLESGLPKLYVNGAELTYDSQNSQAIPVTTTNMRIGTWNHSAGREYSGLMDEVGIWTRAFSATEISDIYQRGAVRLKQQVRSCDDDACIGESFVGPDGTSSDYYEELDNSTLSPPSFTMTNVSDNRYFQYKTFFETDDSMLSPELKSVTVDSTSLNQAPDTPINSAPAIGATGVDLNATLSASAYADTESDLQTDTDWQVDNDSDFSSPVWSRTAGVAESTTAITGANGTFANELAGKIELDHNSTYYFRVRYSDGVWSEYSSSTSFTTNLIITPVNATPADGATLMTLTPLLTASAFADEQITHTHAASQWQVDDNSDFSSITYDSGETASAETSHAVPGASLNNLTSYNWRVRHKDSSGQWSSYSTPTSFAVQISATAVSVDPVFGNTTVDQGDEIKIDAQIVNFTDGSPLNNANSTVTIYNPAGTKIVNSVPMVYVTGSNGIYRYAYTVPNESGSYLYEVTATVSGKSGYGAKNFEVRTIGADTAAAKSTAESEAVAQSAERIRQEAERISQEAERNTQDSERASSTAERSAQEEERTAQDTERDLQTSERASSTVERTARTTERVSSTAERTAQETERDLQTSERASSTAERAAQADSRVTVDDIQNRVTTIGSDVTSIKSDVSSIKGDLASLRSVVDDVDDELNDVVGRLTTDFDGVQERLNSIATKLSELGVLQGEAAKNLYSVSQDTKEDAHYLRNKILDLQAAIEINKALLAGGTQSSVFSTWYTFDSVVLNMLIANPTDRTATIPFKAFLPKEAKPEHIMSSGGLKVEYDESAGSYAVTGEFELAGGESITRKVEMRDVWIIDKSEIAELTRQASELSKHAEDTAYSGQIAILANDTRSRLATIASRQEDNTATPQDHILAYRQNLEDLNVVKDNLGNMTDLITSAGASRSVVGQIGGIQTFSVWGIILAIVFGFGLLAAIIFAMWRHQTMMAASMGGGGGAAAMPGYNTDVRAERRREEEELRDEREDFDEPARQKTHRKKHGKKIVTGIVVAGVLAGAGFVAIKFVPGLTSLFGMGETTYTREIENRDSLPTIVPANEQEPVNNSAPAASLQESETGVATSSISQSQLTITETGTGYLNVRADSSLETDIIGKVYPGETYEYSLKQDGWYRIELSDGEAGWVFGDYVNTNTESSMENSNEAGAVLASKQTLRITDTPTGWLRVRTEPTEESEEIGRVYPKEEYSYTEEENGWYQIVLLDEDDSGWISGEYVTRNTDE